MKSFVLCLLLLFLCCTVHCQKKNVSAKNSTVEFKEPENISSKISTRLNNVLSSKRYTTLGNNLKPIETKKSSINSPFSSRDKFDGLPMGLPSRKGNPYRDKMDERGWFPSSSSVPMKDNFKFSYKPFESEKKFKPTLGDYRPRPPPSELFEDLLESPKSKNKKFPTPHGYFKDPWMKESSKPPELNSYKKYRQKIKHKPYYGMRKPFRGPFDHEYGSTRVYKTPFRHSKYRSKYYKHYFLDPHGLYHYYPFLPPWYLHFLLWFEMNAELYGQFDPYYDPYFFWPIWLRPYRS
ncbi:uncharacterized protein LOC141854847 [Brevipalpus obovatus]|uniref:uncharacterized protein LOC141854847 n=1 Tax=Brevipalpus obovatus TaxID=246614 RepID=UPI003D9E69AD